MRARDGASMKCTNLVSSSVWRQTDVLFDGSCKAWRSTGTMAVNKGFQLSKYCIYVMYNSSNSVHHSERNSLVHID